MVEGKTSLSYRCSHSLVTYAVWGGVLSCCKMTPQANAMVYCGELQVFQDINIIDDLTLRQDYYLGEPILLPPKMVALKFFAGGRILNFLSLAVVAKNVLVDPRFIFRHNPFQTAFSGPFTCRMEFALFLPKMLYKHRHAAPCGDLSIVLNPPS